MRPPPRLPPRTTCCRGRTRKSGGGTRRRVQRARRGAQPSATPRPDAHARLDPPYWCDPAWYLVGYVDSTHKCAPSGGCTLWLRAEEGRATQPRRWWVRAYFYDSVRNRKDSPTVVSRLESGNRLLRWQSYRMDYDAAGSLVAKRTLKASDTTQVVRRDSL